MKKLFVFAAVLCAAITVSCTKNEVARTEEERPSGEVQTVTLTCTLPDTKVSIDDEGKTKWEVDDEIYVHAGQNQHVTVKLTSADILDEGKTAKITFSGLSKYSGSTYKSSYYMIYPADAAGESHYMYYETRFNKFTEPVIGGYDDGDGHFVTRNLCGVIRFKNLTGDFDSYTFEGTNGETVGYAEYQVRLALNNDNSVDYRNTWKNGYVGNGEPQTLNVVSGTVATGNIYNYIVVPGRLNLPNGFTIRFIKDGTPVKTLSTSKAFSMIEGDLVDLGDVSGLSKLRDYVPTYTVVGDASLCGSVWNTFDTNNVLTDNGDGTYSKAYNIPAGTYHFKIVKDHQYSNGEWPNDHDQEYVANKAGKLTIKFNPSTNSITFGFVEAATYTVAGTSNLFGTNWDITDSNNNMTLQADDTFVWSKEVTSAMNIEFKIVKNNDYAQGSWPGSNYQYSIPAAGTIYIYFNPTNGDVTTRFVPKITIDGDMSEWNYISTGVTGVNSVYLEFKAYYDEENLYFYSKRNWQTNLWASGTSAAYIYYFIVDSDSSTGGTNSNIPDVLGIDAFFYLHLFNGTSDSPAFYTDQNGGSSHCDYSNVSVGGYTDKSTIVETEISIPRSDVGVVSGGTYKFYTYGSKDAGNMGEQYVQLTLND